MIFHVAIRISQIDIVIATLIFRKNLNIPEVFDTEHGDINALITIHDAWSLSAPLITSIS